MPSGIRPKVNEAREFLEIAKDFKDPKELIREALSNSWDAQASKASLKFSLQSLPGSRRKKIVVEVSDDGEGMSSEPRSAIGSSEIEGFFNLGDSAKPLGSIGSKGHGAKIFYKSSGITVLTWKNGRKITAQTESDPWDSLQQGIVPTYGYEETDDAVGIGTHILVDGFRGKKSEFYSLDDLTQYLQWYTVVGSFGQYFNQPRRMDVELKPTGSATPVTIPYGFHFPDEQVDLAQGTDSVCKLFGPATLDCGVTEDGKEVTVQLIGALLGDSHRGIVTHTYTQMGLWLCKDFIRIDRQNEILEGVFGGQYYYRQFLIFANCQGFDLTANRNDIRTDQDEFDLAIEAIKKYCKASIWDSEFVKDYFIAKKEEDRERIKEEDEKKKKDKKLKLKEARQERINIYRGRPNLSSVHLQGAPIKEPQSEAETALLLQAMISSNHPGVNFRIGDYNTSLGVDLILETIDKDIETLRWAELVSSLDKLGQWGHPPDGYHMVICYELGKTRESMELYGGRIAKLVSKGQPGRYSLIVDGQNIDVLVLRELLMS